MRDRIKALLANGASRRALLTAGAYIAGAYFGYVMPGGLEAIHEAFQYAVASNPFGDPVSQISALFEGAQYHAAGALHAVGDWFQSVGVEVTQRFREQIDQARMFLGPSLEQAKGLFLELWEPVSEAAANLRDQIRNAIPGKETALTWAKETGKAAFELLSLAVEAYGIYEAGKAVYRKIFSRAKEELREEITVPAGEPEAVTDRSINLNLNTAVGGGAVADAAMRDRQIRFEHAQDPTAGLSALQSDKIIWVSDKLNRRVSSELNDLIADIGTSPERVSLQTPSPTRLEDPADPIGDLSHRSRFPTINWGESEASSDRLRKMRCGSRIGELGRADLKDIRLVIGEEGNLVVESDRPSAPSPDLM